MNFLTSTLPTFLLEQDAWNQGKLVIGIDEAGRGPWAGPVVAGAVIFPACFATERLQGLKDSKKLSARQRNDWFDVITDCAQQTAIGIASAEEIDTYNILQATKMAMLRALDKLSFNLNHHHVLVDAVRFKPEDVAALMPQSTLLDLPQVCTAPIHGEDISLSIAAGAILAKVTRDRMLQELDVQFPGYGFAKHKGYGTKQHQAALSQLGPCAIHRQTYKPVLACSNLPRGKLS